MNGDELVAKQEDGDSEFEAWVVGLPKFPEITHEQEKEQTEFVEWLRGLPKTKSPTGAGVRTLLALGPKAAARWRKNDPTYKPRESEAVK